jgi:hypothetical protein
VRERILPMPPRLGAKRQGSFSGPGPGRGHWPGPEVYPGPPGYR